MSRQLAISAAFSILAMAGCLLLTHGGAGITPPSGTEVFRMAESLPAAKPLGRLLTVNP